jgi:hypothetical protein
VSASTGPADRKTFTCMGEMVHRMWLEQRRKQLAEKPLHNAPPAAAPDAPEQK